jgi:hypothetical protein
MHAFIMAVAAFGFLIAAGFTPSPEDARLFMGIGWVSLIGSMTVSGVEQIVKRLL